MNRILKILDPIWLYDSVRLWLLFRFRTEMLYVFCVECHKARNPNPTMWDVDSMNEGINQFLSNLGMRSIFGKLAMKIPLLVFISLFKQLKMKRTDVNFYLQCYSLSKSIVEKHIEEPTISDVIGLMYFTFGNYWRLRLDDKRD